MLNAKQRIAIKLLVVDGLSQHEIAQKLNCSDVTICGWLKKDEFLLELQKEQRRAFSLAAAKAQKRLIELVDSTNPSVALGACRDVLDRSGWKPVEKVEQQTTVVTVNVDGDGDNA